MQLSKADFLIGLDNQRWISKHVSNSLVEGDNLRADAVRAQTIIRQEGCSRPRGPTKDRCTELCASVPRWEPMRGGSDRPGGLGNWHAHRVNMPRMNCLQRMAENITPIVRDTQDNSFQGI